MSKQQYNLTSKTDYLNRKMFLDPAASKQLGDVAAPLEAIDFDEEDDCESCKL